MKQLFFGQVMIFSLLLAICGCSNGAGFQEGTDLESQEEAGNGKPNPSGGQGSNGHDLPDIGQEETDDNAPEPPELENFYLFSKKEIHLNFSAAVSVISCTFTPYQEIDCIQNGETLKILLKENLELKTEFLIELNVEDDWENSLSVEVPLFVSDWIPKMEINELRTENSGKRTEFIEFKVKSAGDLDKLKLYIMWNAKDAYIFDFPNVYVKSGEYITLHLRTLESNAVDELGEDLSESAGTDSSPTARDLWVPGNSKWLHKTDIVYLKDADGNIMDAVILNETPGEAWSKSQSHFAGIAEDLYNKGVWKSSDGKLPSPFDAVDTSTIKAAATKSISRHEGKEDSNTANDWYVTNTGGASPGQPNK